MGLTLLGCDEAPLPSSAAGPPSAPEPTWVGRGSTPDGMYGFSVAGAGDVDGDGFDDVLVGARSEKREYEMEGAAFLYAGSAEGLSSAPAWTTWGGVGTARCGEAVAGVGDVDGDGFADVAIGLAHYPTGAGHGRVQLHRGGTSGLEPDPWWTTDSDQEESWLGRSVSAAGDVDDDGLADFVVGEKYYDSAAKDAGRVLVYLGGADAPTLAWSFEGEEAGGWLGFSVSGGLDLDGDGTGDLLGGAAFSDVPGAKESGAVFAFGRGSDRPTWVSPDQEAYAWMGYPVAAAGDTNGDGFDDFLAGSHGYAEQLGRAVAWLGSADGPEADAWESLGDTPGDEFGYAVAGVGDVDGDSLSDVVAGSRYFSEGEANEGTLRLFLGPLGAAAWQVQSDVEGAELATSAAGAGDVDGDGLDEVIVGGADAAWLYAGR